jgi:hypothetical protein
MNESKTCGNCGGLLFKVLSQHFGAESSEEGTNMIREIYEGKLNLYYIQCFVYICVFAPFKNG